MKNKIQIDEGFTIGKTEAQPTVSEYQKLMDLLPEDNLVKKCYTYTKEHSPACDSYAFAASMGFVSAIVSPFTRMWTNNYQADQTNLYICLVGDSAVSGKSSAIFPLLKSGILEDASLEIDDFALVTGTIYDTVEGVVEALAVRAQGKTVSLVTIATAGAESYFNSTRAGRKMSAYHKDLYDTDIIDVPPTKAARNKTGYTSDSVRAMCSLVLELTPYEFERIKGASSAINGPLPCFIFIGVDESFECQSVCDHSEKKTTVTRLDINDSVVKYGEGLKERDGYHRVTFNPDSPVVQELNKMYVDAQDMTLDTPLPVRWATMYGIQNLLRTAALIAGCQFERTVSDGVLTALKNIFVNELIPLSSEALTKKSDTKKKNKGGRYSS